MQQDARASTPLITKHELADSLSVSPRHINNLMGDGLPHLRLGRALRFDRREVVDWLKASSQAQQRRAS